MSDQPAVQDPPSTVPEPGRDNGGDNGGKGSGDSGASERIRLWLAVPIAFLSSALAVVCVVSVADVAPRVEDLALVDQRFLGWAGVASALGVGMAAVALLAVPKVGAGPALSLGAAASVFGLALASHVVDPFQLTLVQLLLAMAVSCLLAGAAGMTFELPATHRRRVMVAWALPVASAWPLLAWLSRHVDVVTGSDAPRLTVHPSVWLLAPVSALIVVWSALTMLIEPPRAGVPSNQTWDSAWSALLSTAFGGALATMALGFDPGIPHGWLRPLVLFASGAVIVSLAGITMLVPRGSARTGYLCLLFVMVCFPITVQLLVITTDAGSARVSGWMALLLAAAVAVGMAFGARRPRTVSLALVGVAAACAGCWVMPDTQGWMAAGALPLCLTMGAVFGAGLRGTAGSAQGWRFGAMAVVAVVLLGTVTGTALGWALGGDIPSDTDAARDAGRVFLGVTFAFAVLVAAAISVLRPRPLES